MRAGGTFTLRGFAVPFEQPEFIGQQDCWEVVDRRAFDAVLRNGLPSVFLNLDVHNAPALCRDVTLFTDDYGLAFEARLTESQWSAVHPSIKQLQFCSVFLDPLNSRPDRLSDGTVCRRVVDSGIGHITLTDDKAVYRGTGYWPGPETLVGELPQRLAALSARWQQGYANYRARQSTAKFIDQLRSRKTMSNVTQFPAKRAQGEYRVVNSGGDRGEIWLYGQIGSDWLGEGISAKQFADDLKSLGRVRTIDLRINSDGGAVTDARAMYNLLVSHPARIVVHIDGIAASAASFLAMAGREIEIAEGGFLMIHNASGISVGGAEDHRRMADVLEQVNETIVATYTARTRNDIRQIKKWMDEERWFTGKEAVEHGFADRIVANNMKVAAQLNPSRSFKNTPAVLQRPNRSRAVAMMQKMEGASNER